MSKINLRKENNEILLFRPTGLRVAEPKYIEETPMFVIGELSNEPIRVFKHGHIWTKEDKGALTLACEGTPLTASIADPEETHWVTVKDFLIELWGKEVYDKLPPQIAGPLNQHIFSQVTVVPVDIEKAAVEALDAVKANELLYESNLKLADDSTKTTDEQSTTEKIQDWIMKFGLGAFVMFFLMVKFWGYHV